ncbi:MAG TPA: hypothetical protein VHG52_03510 [Thermomicrobiales bacterium]|nr:hypothetical protein [Thermomicrobiales bacterium]
MPTLEAITGDVRAWYDRYLETFTSLAAGERTDFESLLAFFGVPLVILTEERYLALPTREAVFSTLQTLVDQLRGVNYAGSTVHRLDVRPLNARAAFIDGVFSRHNRVGNELERFGAAYLVAMTDEGWRFTVIVFTAV